MASLGSERETFAVVADKSDQRKARDGFFLKKTTAIALAVAIIVMIIVVGVIAAYLGPRKRRESVNVGTQEGSKASKEPSTMKPITKTPPVTPKPTDSTNKPYGNIRLPKYIKPIHYDVALNIDLKKLRFTGKSSVHFDVKQSTEYLFLHAADMTFSKATVNKPDGTVLQVKEKMEYKINEYYVFVMTSPVVPGKYFMHFEYEAEFNKNLKGLYKSTYKRKNGAEVVIAATQFQPTDARRAFPCFDEPALKATFNISLIHDPNFIAISNMPVISSSAANGLIRDNFQKTVIMPTYLLAFVVCDFQSKTVKSSSGVLMTFYAPPDQIDQLDYAVETGKKILPFFEKYYNIPYPLPKADMIAIPDFAAGAMENWGLMAYRETALLFTPGQSSESNKQFVAVVVAHEVAHQWFGNLVTTEWWSDLWLNEGFASYMEYVGVNYTEPNWRMMDQMVVTDQASAFAADALVTSHPVYVPVNHPNEINEIFDSISYQKGGSILRMLDHFLGQETFLKGLNSYLNKYKYGNAKTGDLWDSLSEASNNKYDVSQVMDTWTRQMGYPVINITRKGNDYQVTQKRFLLDPNPDYKREKYNSPYGYTWHVPFEYITGTKNSVSGSPSAPKAVWLNRDSAEIKGVSSGQWIKGNPSQYGFYRVTYDDQGWNDLVSQMKINHKIFDPKDRAGILGDAFALSRAGMLNYQITLDLLDYIDEDDDYIPWKAANDGISHIGSMFSKISVAGRNYPKYILNKIRPLYNKLGFKQSSGSNQHIETYLRSIILNQACKNGMPECLGNATAMFNKWMQDPIKNAVPADLRSLVYFYGIMNGGEKEWNFAFKQYQLTKLGSERLKLLEGMSAIQEPWMIERYLNYSLDETKVKSQDTSHVFSYISNSNPIGRYYAWYFMKSNWKQISAKFGEGFFTLGKIFSSVTSGFKTDYELKQFDKFVSTLKDTGTITRTISQSRETIKSNIDWLSRSEKTISQWLQIKVV